MRLLIDADILVYRAGFAVEYKGEAEPLSHAKQAMKMMINDLLFRCARRYGDKITSSFYLTSDDKSNFRFEVAKTRTYKGNRKAPKPVHYEDLRLFLMKNYRAETVSGMEADDMLGIQASDSTCIVTLDKDLDMIPGDHYNFASKKFYTVSRTKAYYNFCYQLLIGDSVDNIQGAKGVGPVKATKALSHAGRDKAKMIAIVRDIYDDDEKFLEMGKLLWILRKPGEIFCPDFDILDSTYVDYSLKHDAKSLPMNRRMGESIASTMRRIAREQS